MAPMGINFGSVQAHHGAVEAHQGAVEAHQGAVEANQGPLKAYHRAVKAYNGAAEAGLSKAPWSHHGRNYHRFLVAKATITKIVHKFKCTRDWPRRMK